MFNLTTTRKQPVAENFLKVYFFSPDIHHSATLTLLRTLHVMLTYNTCELRTFCRYPTWIFVAKLLFTLQCENNNNIFIENDESKSFTTNTSLEESKCSYQAKIGTCFYRTQCCLMEELIPPHVRFDLKLKYTTFLLTTCTAVFISIKCHPK